jgi:hypothetical protein
MLIVRRTFIFFLVYPLRELVSLFSSSIDIYSLREITYQKKYTYIQLLIRII